jgi:hypothetical protein
MASLAQQSATSSRIDHVLAVLTRQWKAIPEVVSTWEPWDELDRLDFVIEWPTREIRLKQLRKWNDEGQLSAQQRQRFEEMEQLMQRHRAAVDRLLEE